MSLCDKTLKTLTISCLSLSLLLNTSPAAAKEAKAAPQPAVLSQSEVLSAKIPLDQAIQTAKAAFNIGSEYDSFESGLENYNGQMNWRLSWHRSSEPTKAIEVDINADNGKIMRMYRWESTTPGQKYSGLPKYTYNEGKSLALKWAKQLAGDYYSQVTLLPAEGPHVKIMNNRDSIKYHYRFVRTVNGINFPANNISIRIDADNGTLAGYYVEWDDQLQFPSPANKISAEQAQQILKDNVELTYFQPWDNSQKENPIKLVYQVKRGASLYIDALTGKVIEDAGYDTYYDSSAAGGAGDIGQSQAKELSPQEQAEISKFKNIITAEKAVSKLKEAIDIPKDISLRESRLYEHQSTGQKIWSFYWSGEPGSINAKIDATTGELLSFNKWLNESNSIQKQNYTWENALDIAEKFIKKMQPTRYNEIRLENQNQYAVLPLKERQSLTSCSFSFVRLVNNIPFTNNGFNVTVDLRSGDVTSYSMNWWGKNFPHPTGVIGADKAASLFTADNRLTLEYINQRKSAQRQNVYLVYHLEDTPSYIIDAVSGTFLDWHGKPIKPKQTNNFSDIAGHPAEEDIKLLAAANIITSADGKFYPDKNITKIDALAWLVKSRSYYLDSDEPDLSKRIVEAALELGIIDTNETNNLEKELTRLELAKLMINYLDYDGVAKLKNIFNINVPDADAVPAELRGYTAISLELGLQNLIQGKYQPNEPVTRSEAASALLRLIKVQK